MTEHPRLGVGRIGDRPPADHGTRALPCGSTGRFPGCSFEAEGYQVSEIFYVFLLA